MRGIACTLAKLPQAVVSRNGIFRVRGRNIVASLVIRRASGASLRQFGFVETRRWRVSCLARLYDDAFHYASNVNSQTADNSTSVMLPSNTVIRLSFTVA